MTTPTTKNTKWLKISLISGIVIGLICCIGIAVLLFFANTMNNITQDNDTWVRSLAWSPYGSKIAVGSSNHTVTIWDVTSGRLLITIVKHTSWVRELAWSPDGTMLASGAGNGVIYLWNPQTGKLIEQLTQVNEQDALGYLAWSPDGALLAYTGDSGNIMLFDVVSKQKILFFKSTGAKNLTNIITGISWSPDGTRLVTSSADGTISVWDIQTGEKLWGVSAHQGWANDVEWSSDVAYLASGGDDSFLKVWDAETGNLINQTKSTNPVFGVAWSPKIKSQIAWDNVSQVAITDFQQPDIFLNAGNSNVWVVAWSQDGQLLAAGTSANTVYIWDVNTNQQIQLLTVPNAP